MGDGEKAGGRLLGLFPGSGPQLLAHHQPPAPPRLRVAVDGDGAVTVVQFHQGLHALGELPGQLLGEGEGGQHRRTHLAEGAGHPVGHGAAQILQAVAHLGQPLAHLPHPLADAGGGGGGDDPLHPLAQLLGHLRDAVAHLLHPAQEIRPLGLRAGGGGGCGRAGTAGASGWARARGLGGVRGVGRLAQGLEQLHRLLGGDLALLQQAQDDAALFGHVWHG